MKPVLSVVKIGGNVIDSPAELSNFLSEFASISGPKLLVHGGGKIATTVAEKLGVETKFIEGRRVTSPEMMDVALMVYAGLVNKKIVAELGAKNCPAIGMSGADGSTVISRKRSPIPVDYGEVGDVDFVDGRLLEKLINDGITPVFCAVTVDTEGCLLNTNADTMAEEIAIGMGEFFDVRLFYCFEKKGVMNNENVIPQIDSDMFEKLKAEGIVAAGMIPKISNALRAAKSPGVIDVIIKSSSDLLVGSGTVIVG